MKKDKAFDFDAFQSEAIEQINDGKSLLGKGGVFTPLLKRFLEASLEVELEDHLSENEDSNRRNGHGNKRVKSTLGTIDLSTPRDRNGSFEPKTVAKRQSVLSEDLDELILFLYSQGSSYNDIRTQLDRFYGVEMSEATISRVTERVWPLVQQWQSRPLDAVYPFVWLDAIHFKVRSEGRVISKAVYCVGSTKRVSKSFLACTSEKMKVPSFGFRY